MDIDSDDAALKNELALLQAMYPDEASCDLKISQFRFKLAAGILELRLPEKYPSSSLPELILATGPDKRDLRAEMSRSISEQHIGQPCLDAITVEFTRLIENLLDEHVEDNMSTITSPTPEQSKTVVIWLHHLLATSKRKQALHPEVPDASRINGITKPGFPGVMIFSGPAEAVERHCNALKQLRWQAFQIRFETATQWLFQHGHGIIEVETMTEVVTGLGDSMEQKTLFMKAMKIR